ncbi:MAG TPA: carboxypeptidase-like regulatory domain-containing protein [Mucilaginibacter sp.]|jgi:hypothetical protein|nr:carboxypeptidase-like regulatory domain-containing protein [Mucilaginibacter sp.]
MGYDWKTIFDPKLVKLQFNAEKDFTIQGKVTNVLNQPLKKAGLALLQKQPFFTMDTVTNDEGRFTFKSPNMFPADSAYYLIQAKDKKGGNKTFNVGIEVDEFVSPVFAMAKHKTLPWYVNTDTVLLNNSHTKTAQINAWANYKGEGHLLKEVIINAKKIIPESHNLNGPGGADYTLDEKDMNAAKKMTLFQVLQHKFKDFHGGGNSYYLDYHGNWIEDIFIDGYSISKFNFLKSDYMDGLTAEDIKGVEIMKTGQYAMSYKIAMESRKIQKPRQLPAAYMPGMIFLEVTTYSGQGAFLKHVPGKYIYKPIALQLPKEVYHPKYTIKNRDIAPGTDLRSTIHWEPNMITDKDGKATVSFFTADKPANYSVLIEGTDLNGSLGYQRSQIKSAL